MAKGSYPLGGAAPSFAMQEILLYCLQVTISTNTYIYTGSSGSYTCYTSIGAFMSDLQAGRLPAPNGALPPFASGEAVPDIIIVEPCFVVVALSSPDQPTLCFQATGMTTGADCSNKYYALTEAGTSSAGNPTVAYFAVPVVAPASLGVADPYTLFLQYISGGSTILYDIDPCLRNQGPG
ncbi:MAG TPA: hypothetical protein VHY79_10250 [Rhizomicrobium sp.]|jgi:hypothetical protein|nr:hypothetical protein [Rhizomicrobium sp.]